MSIHDVRSQIIVAQHDVSVASYHYGEEVAFTRKAVEGGTAAIPELRAAVDGVTFYITNTEQMVQICDLVESEPRSAEHFITRRESVISSGRDTLDHLKTATEMVIQYCASHDNANAQTHLACSRVDDVQQALSELGEVSSFSILQKLNQAYIYAGDHITSLHAAKDFIHDQYPGDALDEQYDVAELQTLTHSLKEGMFLLHRTFRQEPYEWAHDVKLAHAKISEEHLAYLTSLTDRIGSGVMASGFCIDRCNEMIALMKSVAEDSEKLLADL